MTSVNHERRRQILDSASSPFLASKQKTQPGELHQTTLDKGVLDPEQAGYPTENEEHHEEAGPAEGHHSGGVGHPAPPPVRLHRNLAGLYCCGGGPRAMP